MTADIVNYCTETRSKNEMQPSTLARKFLSARCLLGDKSSSERSIYRFLEKVTSFTPANFAITRLSVEAKHPSNARAAGALS